MPHRIIEIYRTEQTPTEPVTLQQAKDWLRITFNDEDALITSLITQCRKSIEKYTSVSLVAAAVTVTVDLDAMEFFLLPYGPSGGAIALTYYSDPLSNTYTTLTASDFSVRGYEKLEIMVRTPGYHTISYNVFEPTDIEDFVLALKAEVAFRYEYRGDETQIYANQNVGVCQATQAILQPHVNYSYI